jgi:ferritin-like metal-binding protein YciE
MAIHIQRSTSSSPETAATMRLRSTLAGLSQALTAARHRIAAPMTDSLEVMYHAELQDLQSAELQTCAAVDEIWVEMHDEALAQRVSDYGAQMRSRRADLEDLLARLGPETRRHPDRAMRALVREAIRIDETYAENLRDAAWVAALQRIIHHMIASYGTIAAHAKALGRTQDAARFAECADQEQVAVAELSELAKNTLDLQAIALGKLESVAGHEAAEARHGLPE